ncbi:hypothetical protein TSUD_400020 [Trifolium subterraneum]|uniref:Reverse transcriptase domain-containing protein n=1 Tax=Trifolium subterraneum TaxID=3900 RepID=A0A2Z6NKI4_TRISU|nr:hypothetical protein TSUD_400020 [Trifolium subterraneum]
MVKRYKIDIHVVTNGIVNQYIQLLESQGEGLAIEKELLKKKRKRLVKIKMEKSEAARSESKGKIKSQAERSTVIIVDDEDSEDDDEPLSVRLKKKKRAESLSKDNSGSDHQTHSDHQTSPELQPSRNQTQPEQQSTEELEPHSDISEHTEVVVSEEIHNSPSSNHVDAMVRELHVNDFHLKAFDQQQQQPQPSPQHTITPSITEPHPNNPDILSECNSLLSQIHGIHELRHSDMSSSEYAAQWVSLTEELVKKLHSLQEVDIEEQKRFDKGKAKVVEEVIQNQKDTERNQPESSTVRDSNLNEAIQENLRSNQEHLRNPVYGAEIEIIKAKMDKPTLDGLIFAQLSNTDNDALIGVFSEKEIREAVWSCDRNKSPGPDGFNFNFLKTCWNVVKDDFMNFFHEFHQHAAFPKGFTASFLTLIPKKDHPQNLSYYRPISLIDCVYKVLSKVLASRLKKVLGKLISKCQSAFLPQRQILDGVLVINELIDLAKRTKNQCFLMKVGFEKAYDTVNWRYLDDMMRNMGFTDTWIRWMRACIFNSSMSV